MRNFLSVMRVSDYRRKRLEPYGEAVSHELFRPDHTANAALRALAQRDAMHDCAAWLAAGNSVAVSITGKLDTKRETKLGGESAKFALDLEVNPASKREQARVPLIEKDQQELRKTRLDEREQKLIKNDRNRGKKKNTCFFFFFCSQNVFASVKMD